MLNNQIIERLLQKKVIPSLDELKQLTIYLIQQGFNTSQILEILEKCEMKFELKGVKIENIVQVLIKMNPSQKKEKQEKFEIYSSEVEYLKNVGDATERKILFLLLTISKHDNHPTGWIKYNRNLLFKFWGLKLTSPQKSVIINRCCKNGAIDLRVIGSKNPIVCFKVNFQNYDFSDTAEILKFDEKSIIDFYDSYLWGNE
jgi:hypothetical protein